jgi:hypothetical protein
MLMLTRTLRPDGRRSRAARSLHPRTISHDTNQGCRSPQSHPSTAERSRHAIDASAGDARSRGSADSLISTSGRPDGVGGVLGYYALSSRTMYGWCEEARRRGTTSTRSLFVHRRNINHYNAYGLFGRDNQMRASQSQSTQSARVNRSCRRRKRWSTWS